jgi:hypothetical protein
MTPLTKEVELPVAVRPTSRFETWVPALPRMVYPPERRHLDFAIKE